MCRFVPRLTPKKMPLNMIYKSWGNRWLGSCRFTHLLKMVMFLNPNHQPIKGVGTARKVVRQEMMK